MGEWKAQSGRITLFPTIPTGASFVSALELYRAIWNLDPDSFQKQPQSNLGLAASSAQGTHNGLSVSCTATPVRIDFSVMPNPGSTGSIPVIEDSGSLRNELSELAIAVVEKLAVTINRAACFVQFLNPADSFREANKNIRSVLPREAQIELIEEEDFILQLNRPRRVADLPINFITRWSVDRLQLMNLQVGGPVQQGGPAQIILEKLVASVQFDNNNVPTMTLSKGQIGVILQECLRGVSSNLKELNLAIDGF